ncbi:hypothetical protein DPMN_072405 [Dreissena polymorpha]|uniref:Uncharacterized protein n=1 Tax=Dreissena polymorpha TaxID=45954 RepID=A0A9D4BWU3_DREPO|nr:hypothetical protein DPMN_072405 [Dreissena polymorpha]
MLQHVASSHEHVDDISDDKPTSNCVACASLTEQLTRSDASVMIFKDEKNKGAS